MQPYSLNSGAIASDPPPKYHRVEHLQRGHDLAGRKGADLKLAVGDLADALGDELRAAVERVQALRPARRQAPLEARQSRSLLRPRLRRRDEARTRRRAQPGVLQEFASFHW
jgi:hypothetical protein